MINEFSRTEMLIGTDNLNILKNSTVAIFGIGGVGSFVLEALVRTGISNFILIDFDSICITNINRQILATQDNIGELKVDIAKKRALSINPNANIKVVPSLYNKENAEILFPYEADYIVDAIDMASSKLDIIERSIQHNIKIISSMGTGNKINPAMFEITDIHKTSVCPLARIMRRELKKRGVRKLKVLYSKENPRKPVEIEGLNATPAGEKKSRQQTAASISFMPSSAGLLIASELVKDLISHNFK